MTAETKLPALDALYLAIIILAIVIIAIVFQPSSMTETPVSEQVIINENDISQTQTAIQPDSNQPESFANNASFGVTAGQSYNVTIGVGGGGGGSVGNFVPFNETECNISSLNYGNNCSCFSCGLWAGYDTRGFYNTTGVYYDDGTPTGMTMKTMADYEEKSANIRYEQDMNSYGHYRVNGKWV